MRRVVIACLLLLVGSPTLGQQAQAGRLQGRVTDESGTPLPGVTVEIQAAVSGAPIEAVTGDAGDYAFEGLAPGHYQLTFTLMTFTPVILRDVVVGVANTPVNAVLRMELSAEVSVTTSRRFVSVADVEDPAANLIGIAQSSSQGAITARQLDVRPLLRVGEVLETVPGMIASSHAGGGKANQYFLRGFNLDHGTDFAQTIAGLPVNMPSHAHGQGYSDINFMLPELVGGVQYSKGPYFADQGDFATAGAASTSYVSVLARPILSVEGGGQGYARAVAAASPSVGAGHLLIAFEGAHNDGPWVQPDDFNRLNGVVRYTHGDTINGFNLAAMAYHGSWTSTDTVPQRAFDQGLVSRFGTLDPTDGGSTYRYSISGEWQHGGRMSMFKAAAFGIGSDLKLFSNFTNYLDDSVHGDQHEQVDHRFITGGNLSYRTLNQWGQWHMQNTVGVAVRNDDIGTLALYHTQGRVRLSTVSQDAVIETTTAAYAQNETVWLPWLRTLAGLRGDITRFQVDALQPWNSGVKSAGIVSPKGGMTLGPWKKTEFYVNGGSGFHSNDARGILATRDSAGNPVQSVTPLARANGGEVGVRTVAFPHVQTTFTLWTLRLASELTWDGDTFASTPNRASRREGMELANYYSPTPWLQFDGDLSWSRARFTEHDPIGDYVPEAVENVASAGASLTDVHRLFGSIRWRFFGPRPLVEDNSVRSNATSLFELEGGYRISRQLRLNVSIFNLFNTAASDIDYYYVARLPGEPPAGIADVETHPTLSRTVRVTLQVWF
jgi:hypothetical protein